MLIVITFILLIILAYYSLDIIIFAETNTLGCKYLANCNLVRDEDTVVKDKVPGEITFKEVCFPGNYFQSGFCVNMPSTIHMEERELRFPNFHWESDSPVVDQPNTLVKNPTKKPVTDPTKKPVTDPTKKTPGKDLKKLKKQFKTNTDDLNKLFKSMKKFKKDLLDKTKLEYTDKGITLKYGNKEVQATRITYTTSNDGTKQITYKDKSVSLPRVNNNINNPNLNSEMKKLFSEGLKQAREDGYQIRVDEYYRTLERTAALAGLKNIVKDFRQDVINSLKDLVDDIPKLSKQLDNYKPPVPQYAETASCHNYGVCADIRIYDKTGNELKGTEYKDFGKKYLPNFAWGGMIDSGHFGYHPNYGGLINGGTLTEIEKAARDTANKEGNPNNWMQKVWESLGITP